MYKRQDEDNATAEDTEAIYRLVAAVLNNNMGKVPVTEEDVADYDIEECTAILNAYMEFVNELKPVSYTHLLPRLCLSTILFVVPGLLPLSQKQPFFCLGLQFPGNG